MDEKLLIVAVLRAFIFCIISVLFLDCCCYGIGGPLNSNPLGVPDTLAVVGKIFTYKIPDDVFPAQNIIKYKVRQAGSKGLPLWLDYDELSRTLYGVPTTTDEGLIYIKVIAIKEDHHTLSDVFSIDVQLGSPLPSVPEKRVRQEAPQQVLLNCSSHQPKTLGTLLLDGDMGQITGLERVKVIDEFASFLSLHSSEVMLSLPMVEGVRKLLGISVLASGPGDTNLTTRAHQGGLQLSWPIGCGQFGKIKDLSLVLDHNCRSGRMSNVIGFGVVGWYICLETPLDYYTSGGRRKRQVASAAQLLGTPLATPSITPSPPVAVISTTLLTDLPVVVSSPLQVSSSLELPPPSTMPPVDSVISSPPPSIVVLQPSSDSSSSALPLLPTTMFTETPPLTTLLPVPSSSTTSAVSSSALSTTGIPSLPSTPITGLTTTVNITQTELFSFTLSSELPLLSSSLPAFPFFSLSTEIIASSLPFEFNSSFSDFFLATDFTTEQSLATTITTATTTITPSNSSIVAAVTFSSLSYVASVEESLVPSVYVTSFILVDVLSTIQVDTVSIEPSLPSSPIDFIFSTISPSATEIFTQPLFFSSSIISNVTLDLSSEFSGFVPATLSSEILSTGSETLGPSFFTDIPFPETSVLITPITDIVFPKTSDLITPITEIALPETSVLIKPITSTGLASMLMTSLSFTTLQNSTAIPPPTSVFSISSSPVAIVTPTFQSLLLTQQATPIQTTAAAVLPSMSSQIQPEPSHSTAIKSPAVFPSLTSASLTSALFTSALPSEISTSSLTTRLSPSENMGIPSLSSLPIISSVPASSDVPVIASSPSLTSAITAAVSSSITVDYPTTPKPTTPTPAPPNLAPVIINPIDYLTVAAGSLLNFTIPEDTFYDYEDGTTSNLQLTLVTLDLQPVSPASWIQLDSDSQTLYGIPLDIDLSGSPYFYALVATDSEGKQNWEVFIIELFAQDSSLLTHLITFHFDLNFANFVGDRNSVVDLVDRVASYYGDEDSSYLTILAVSDGSVILSFYNNTLIGQDCNQTAIEQLYSQLANLDGTFNAAFLKVIVPEFPPQAISLGFLGACVTTEQTTLVGSTELPGIVIIPLPASESGQWVTSVIPATCVAAALLVVGLGAFLLYRCKRSSQKDVSPEEKQIYMNNRRPVIMDDETEVKQPKNFTRPTRPSVLLNDISPFSRTPPSRPRRGRPLPPTYRLPQSALVNPVFDPKSPEKEPTEETAKLPPYTLQPIYTRPPPAYSLPPPYLINNTQDHSNI